MLCQLTDDAPEEFIDPISLMLMQQPMRVPTSPYVMDRKTLVAHLAINPTGRRMHTDRLYYTTLIKCTDRAMSPHCYTLYCIYVYNAVWKTNRPLQQTTSDNGNDISRCCSQNKVF